MLQFKILRLTIYLSIWNVHKHVSLSHTHNTHTVHSAQLQSLCVNRYKPVHTVVVRKKQLSQMDKLTICTSEANAQPSQAHKKRAEQQLSDTHWSHSTDSLVLIVGQTKVCWRGARAAHSERPGISGDLRRWGEEKTQQFIWPEAHYRAAGGLVWKLSQCCQ